MQDRQLYEQILGLQAPWYVQRVELQLGQESGAVHVYLEHPQDQLWPCPECRQQCVLYDHQAERRWRHLDTCQYQTILHAAPPRSDCPEHGPRVVKLPWAEPNSRFTALFERLAIDWLQIASQTAVARQLGLTWDEIHAIMERAVERGLKRRQAEPIQHIGIDEKAFRKGHRYLTLVNDLDRCRVLYVSADRKQSSLDDFWPTLTESQRGGIEAVAMDMWDPYVDSTKLHLLDAESKIVFDQFHIAKHLGEAVDQVRRQENKQLRAEGDNSLVGTKYDWLRHPANFDPDAWRKFKYLRESNLKTARAWALKQTAMTLFSYHYTAAARSFFQRWYSWASRCRLKPIIEAGRMLKRRLPNILTFIKHRITNAASESINAKVQWVKYTARGFRNQRNFIHAIYFHCGGLDLAP